MAEPTGLNLIESLELSFDEFAGNERTIFRYSCPKDWPADVPRFGNEHLELWQVEELDEAKHRRDEFLNTLEQDIFDWMPQGSQADRQVREFSSHLAQLRHHAREMHDWCHFDNWQLANESLENHIYESKRLLLAIAQSATIFSRVGRKTAEVRQQSVPSWLHDESEVQPPTHQCGPVAGTKTELGFALRREADPNVSKQRLRDFLGETADSPRPVVWVRKCPGSRTLEAYFMTQERQSKAEARIAEYRKRN